MRIHSLFTPTAEQKAKFTHRPQHRGGVGGLGSLLAGAPAHKEAELQLCSPGTCCLPLALSPAWAPPDTGAPSPCRSRDVCRLAHAAAPDSYGPSSGAPRPRDARFRRANSPSHHAGKAGCSLSHRGARLAGRWQYKSN